MNIKQQALEAARPHAKSIEDLIEKASKIEAYLLGTTALTQTVDPLAKYEPLTMLDDYFAQAKDTAAPKREAFNPRDMLGPIVDTATNEPLAPPTTGLLNPFDPNSLPELIEDEDSRAVLSLARALVADLTEMGFAEPDMGALNRTRSWKEQHEREKIRLREMADFVESCDITKGTPPPPMENLRDERKMSNYEIERRDGGGVDYVKLRPMQLQLGLYMAESDVVLNVCRQFGTTTMIAAFARQEQAAGSGNKILVLTNTHKNALILHEMIDDAAVNVYDFNQLASMNHAGESYNYIIIDNAAFIPWAVESKIIQYIESCRIKGSEFNPRPTKIALISVPGQEAGWFYGAFTAPDHDDVRKLAIDWRFGPMKQDQAKALKESVGPTIFGNQFENKFRPVDVPLPDGVTDITK